MTIEWWDPTTASNDSIWYEEENTVGTNNIWNGKEEGESLEGDNKENGKVEDDLWAQEEVTHLTRLGRHFEPFEIKGDHLRRETDKGKDVIVSEEEKEDGILKQLKKTHASITIYVY